MPNNSYQLLLSKFSDPENISVFNQGNVSISNKIDSVFYGQLHLGKIFNGADCFVYFVNDYNQISVASSGVLNDQKDIFKINKDKWQVEQQLYLPVVLAETTLHYPAIESVLSSKSNPFVVLTSVTLANGKKASFIVQ